MDRAVCALRVTHADLALVVDRFYLRTTTAEILARELGIEPAGARLGNFPAQRAIELNTVCAHECLLALRESLHSRHYQARREWEQDSTCRIFESVGCRMPYMV